MEVQTEERGRILAIIGGGGKTTSLCALAEHLKEQRVLMTTTTHILPVYPPRSRVLLPDPQEGQLLRELSRPGIVCAGVLENRGDHSRLCALSPTLLEKAARQADWVLCEADGANRRPLKLHKDTEPVIPDHTDLCLILAGLSALGCPVSQAIHRYERNPDWAEDPDRKTTWEDLLFCIRENIRSTGLPVDRITVVLNQTDTLSDPSQAEPWIHSVEQLGVRCLAGSMQNAPLSLIRSILW